MCLWHVKHPHKVPIFEEIRVYEAQGNFRFYSITATPTPQDFVDELFCCIPLKRKLEEKNCHEITKKWRCVQTWFICNIETKIKYSLKKKRTF